MSVIVDTLCLFFSHWAISNETAFGVCTIVEICKKLGVQKPVCIQNDFSLTDRRFQAEVIRRRSPPAFNVATKDEIHSISCSEISQSRTTSIYHGYITRSAGRSLCSLESQHQWCPLWHSLRRYAFTVANSIEHSVTLHTSYRTRITSICLTIIQAL